MSDQDGPPAGMETKQTPGYVPAPVVAGDHPGHAVGFGGVSGYTNTPGIGDPEPAAEKSTAEDKPTTGGGTTKSTVSKTTAK